MAYLGAQPNKTLTKTTSQSFNGTGSATVFTLNRAVNTEEELEVFVENVQQEPGSGKSYTATGTTLTFDAAPPSGTGNIYVIYRGQAEVTTRLEHDANQALSATTGTFSGAVSGTDGTFSGDLAVGVASPETTVHIEGDVSGLGGGNVMHIESNGAGGNRGINIGQVGDGSQARMFLQGYHSQSASNYWQLALNPYGGSVLIGTDNDSLFNAEGTNSALTVAGSDTSTTTLGNGGAAINIVQTDGTAGNTAGLHFSREDTDGTPNYSGASIVGQFPDAQVTGQYPKGRLHFHTSTTANAAPSLKMTIDEIGSVTMPQQPFAAVTMANPPAMTTNGGLHTTGSVQINNGSCWNSSTHRFTAPSAGNYMFILTGYTTFTNQYGYISLYRNGVNYKTHHFNHNGHQQHTIGTLSMGVPLGVNDYLELRQGGAGTGHWQQLYLTIFKAT